MNLKSILNITNSDHVQNSFPRAPFPQTFHNFLYNISLALIFLYPETTSSKTILLTFLLIKHNSIPHIFFMKTHILLCYYILKYFSNFFLVALMAYFKFESSILKNILF